MVSGCKKKVLVAGATGYIGKAVVAELLDRDYIVFAIVRKENQLEYSDQSNLNVISLEIGKNSDWTKQLPKVDIIISCLASRSGCEHDTNFVDYSLNSDLLYFALKIKLQHFILLSAICIQKPKLAFQRAKLRFNSKLMSSGLRYSIVLPTAFFKSLSGQVNRIKNGKSFLVFGTGKRTSSLPISEIDLAKYIVNCIGSEESWNKSLPVGGPGPAVTPIDQAEMLFKIFDKPKKIKHISPRFFDFALVLLFPVSFFSQKIKDKVELLKIGKYYAEESMLYYDAEANAYDASKTPQFGEKLLYEYYCSLRDEPEKIPDMGSQKLFS